MSMLSIWFSVNAIHVDANLDAKSSAVLSANQDGMRSNREAIGIFAAEVGKMRVGVVGNAAIPGDITTVVTINSAGWLRPSSVQVLQVPLLSQEPQVSWMP